MAFQTSHKLPPLNLNGKVLGFHIARDREGDIELVDLLRPLVRQCGLFFGLVCAGGSRFGGCGFCL